MANPDSSSLVAVARKYLDLQDEIDAVRGQIVALDWRLKDCNSKIVEAHKELVALHAETGKARSLVTFLNRIVEVRAEGVTIEEADVAMNVTRPSVRPVAPDDIVLFDRMATSREPRPDLTPLNPIVDKLVADEAETARQPEPPGIHRLNMPTRRNR